MNDEIFEISLLMNIEYIFSKLIYKEIYQTFIISSMLSINIFLIRFMIIYESLILYNILDKLK